MTNIPADIFEKCQWAIEDIYAIRGTYFCSTIAQEMFRLNDPDFKRPGLEPNHRMKMQRCLEVFKNLSVACNEEPFDKNEDLEALKSYALAATKYAIEMIGYPGEYRIKLRNENGSMVVEK